MKFCLASLKKITPYFRLAELKKLEDLKIGCYFFLRFIHCIALNRYRAYQYGAYRYGAQLKRIAPPGMKLTSMELIADYFFSASAFL